jgi:acyl-CoA synthetase (NDP forming)
MEKILSNSKGTGWVLEPDAKRLFSLAGMDVPRFTWAVTPEEAIRFAKEIGYPVVAKVVSPRVIHKSERNGVAIGLTADRDLVETFRRFSQIEEFAGMLVEETFSGRELIVGARVDYQFGPVVLLGMGGTAVEIYQDISMRMAPLGPRDVETMVQSLKAHPLLAGYRGAEPINRGELTRLLMTFSALVVDLGERIDSIDLNPVICSSSRCTVADARIILHEATRK